MSAFQLEFGLERELKDRMLPSMQKSSLKHTELLSCPGFSFPAILIQVSTETQAISGLQNAQGFETLSSTSLVILMKSGQDTKDIYGSNYQKEFGSCSLFL